jgi:ABC-2 type transport system permease protein/lipopolysaccharide transport system permease protein
MSSGVNHAAAWMADGPPADLKFRRRLRPRQVLRDLWHAREMVRALAERDFRARYKQAILGSAWALITPLVLMVAFTLVFTRVAEVDTAGAPYPLFSYLGLLPWTFFMASVSQGAMSLLNNVMLVNKVYCPREVFPISSVIVATVDMLVASVVLVVLFAIYGEVPSVYVVLVPVMFVIQVMFTLGVTLALSAIVVYLRDVRHAIPLLLQMGMFATPVAYSLDVIPEQWVLPYVFVNPLGAVIDGYRDVALYGRPPDPLVLAVGAAGALVTLCVGYAVFKRLERGVADVA